MSAGLRAGCWWVATASPWPRIRRSSGIRCRRIRTWCGCCDPRSTRSPPGSIWRPRNGADRGTERSPRGEHERAASLDAARRFGWDSLRGLGRSPSPTALTTSPPRLTTAQPLSAVVIVPPVFVLALVAVVVIRVAVTRRHLDHLDRVFVAVMRAVRVVELQRSEVPVTVRIPVGVSVGRRVGDGGPEEEPAQEAGD